MQHLQEFKQFEQNPRTNSVSVNYNPVLKPSLVRSKPITTNLKTSNHFVQPLLHIYSAVLMRYNQQIPHVFYKVQNTRIAGFYNRKPDRYRLRR